MGPVGTYKQQQDEAYLVESGAAMAQTETDAYTPWWKQKSFLVLFPLLALSYLLIVVLFGLVLSLGSRLPSQVTKLHNQLQRNMDFYPCGSRSREWEYFDGRCYYFGIEAVPWHTAKSHCEERNSKLVVIQDEPEQNFIQSQTKGERYWIGLSDVNVEGEWKWIDDTDYRTSYKNWKSGEPNDHGDHGEDCAQVSSAGQWNDLRCNTASFYVCEKPLPS
ncbi:hepatic lectin-like isoform X2 [Varanus komodoensis]|uniref:hepatic lectin-like isoform X2 n=1 Tax=Varanus komodoensis TaxID=61221 RepID=UPI001CF7B596|nr:hepatic lectin-like isoform X2 [Varanus komodoensis]